MKNKEQEPRIEDTTVTTKFCKKCGKKLIFKSKWNKVEYDEMNGDALHFKYSACPDIEKPFVMDNNNQPIIHSQTYKIKRMKND